MGYWHRIQGQSLGWYDQGQSRRSLPATLTADCSTILRFSGKWYTGTASSSSSCEADLVSACRRNSALWGRCSEVPEPDISGRGETCFVFRWIWLRQKYSHADSVTGTFTLSLTRLSKIAWQDFRQLWHRSVLRYEDVLERKRSDSLPPALK